MSTVSAPPERTLDDSRRWLAEGTDSFRVALARLSDEAMAAPTPLPEWTGKHVVAHVAANADALRNLVTWARTGEPTPMYASPEQRVADIEAGSRREPGALRDWFEASAAALAADLDSLDPAQWATQIVTAQGRAVAATEIPWMRVREVMVHGVDLATVRFADLPHDFLAALVTDVLRKLASAPGPSLRIEPLDSPLRWTLSADGGDPLAVGGTLADLTAYLTGRPGGAVSMAGKPAPALPRWL